MRRGDVTGDKFLHQWHETSRIEEGGVVYFLKNFEPNSYEIKTELNWLLSNMIGSCHNFGVPNVHDASVDKGYIKMEFIEHESGKPNDQIVDYLVSAAAELHSLVKAENPKLRNPVAKDGYNAFLRGYTQQRIDSLKGTQFELPEDVVNWILVQVDKLRVDFFSIVHRDMRARHLLFPKDTAKKPVLIDWEFSNISDPAQDLAKIIYDGTTHDLDRKAITSKVLDDYARIRGVSADELAEHVYTFLPIIPLERSMSLIKRKPEGYEEELLKDLYFIKAIYDEKK